MPINLSALNMFRSATDWNNKGVANLDHKYAVLNDHVYGGWLSSIGRDDDEKEANNKVRAELDIEREKPEDRDPSALRYHESIADDYESGRADENEPGVFEYYDTKEDKFKSFRDGKDFFRFYLAEQRRSWGGKQFQKWYNMIQTKQRQTKEMKAVWTSMN